MEKISALYSQYVIDGIPQELSPGRMLDDYLSRPHSPKEAPKGVQILDETCDPAPVLINLDSWKIRDYLTQVTEAMELEPRRPIPALFASQYTKLTILSAINDTLWRKGHFRLGDLQLSLRWSWDMEPIGGAAAFYASAQSASDYLSSLSLRLSCYDFETSAQNSLKVGIKVEESPEEEDEFPVEQPFRTAKPKLGAVRKDLGALDPDPSSWLVYIPMESCDYRLGGSLLADLTGQSAGGIAPDPSDPDYFIDCFEVIREMVEDGVVIAGTTAGEGGLMAALKRLCDASGERTGARIKLSELMAASQEQDPVRILFSEVPGVVIQVRDEDFDYLDAELMLQDVAFFPLGHPAPGIGEIKVDSAGKSGIQNILESLIRSHSSEGED